MISIESLTVAMAFAGFGSAVLLFVIYLYIKKNA